MLNYLNSYIAALDLKNRVILYLIPLMILGSYIYHMDEIHNIKSNRSVKKAEPKRQKVPKKLNKIEILSSIDKHMRKNKIEMKSIEIDDRELKYSLLGNFEKTHFLLYYMEHLEKSLNIKEYEISKADDENLSMNITLAVGGGIAKRVYTLEEFTLNVKELRNPFVKYKKKDDQIRVKAIVGEFVQINDEILKVNDYYKKMQIQKICKDCIMIKKGKQTIKLKVFKDEKINRHYHKL